MVEVGCNFIFHHIMIISPVLIKNLFFTHCFLSSVFIVYIGQREANKTFPNTKTKEEKFCTKITSITSILVLKL